MKKILVIDSDTEVLNLLQVYLQQAGLSVICSQSGQEGLSLVPKADLAIISVEMPDMNGFVICSNIKKDSRISHIPVILTSSTNDTTAFEKHSKLPTSADGYFLKPLDLDTLLEEITAIFYNIDQNGEIAEEQAEEPVLEPAASESDNVEGEGGDFSESEAKEEPEAAPASAQVAEAPKASASTASRLSTLNKLTGPSTIAANNAAKVPGLPPKLTGLPKSKLPSAPKPSVSRLSSPATSPAKASTPAAAPAATLTAKPLSSSPALAPAPSLSPSASMSSTFPKATALSGLSGDRLGSSDSKPGVQHTISASASFTAVSQSSSQKAELSRLNDEITVLKNEINLLKSEITTRDNRITMLQSQCDALTSRCQNAESIAEQLRSEAAEISAHYDEIAQSDAERNAQMDAFIAADNEKTEQLNALIAADNEKTEQIEALIHATEEKNAQIEAIAQQLLALIQQ